MEFTAEQIAGLLQGDVDGNPSASVNGLAKIEEGNEGSLSFLSNPKSTIASEDVLSVTVFTSKVRA